MAFSFTLCPECLARYRDLTYEPTSDCFLDSIPFCSLVWRDEHPEESGIPFPDPNHKSCRNSILRLAGARTGLWRTGTIAEESKELWAQAQRLIPNWPGFRRLSLSAEQRLSLEACAGELQDFLGAIAKDYPQMTFTDKGGGLTELSARRAEGETPPRPPMRVMEFSKGPALALAFEFYPENVDAFTRELPKVRPVLLDWKANHGSRCEMIMFTVVSAPQHHTAIESVIQQVCGNESELAPLLHSLEVRVALYIDPDGESVKEYSLTKAAPGEEASHHE